MKPTLKKKTDGQGQDEEEERRGGRRKHFEPGRLLGFGDHVELVLVLVTNILDPLLYRTMSKCQKHFFPDFIQHFLTIKIFVHM